MSFALTELTRLLVPAAPVIGVVVRRHGDQVQLATAQGALTARAGGALSVGDRVLVRHGIATRAPRAGRIEPV